MCLSQSLSPKILSSSLCLCDAPHRAQSADRVRLVQHEAVEGQFNFEGDRDLSKFLATAQKVGLLVVLRAGPYMCGEWEFGGLPAWIFKNGSIPIRTYSQPYISYVDKWWQGQLLPLIKPHLYSAGGNVVMVQCENEYGSYGDVSKHPTDMQYMVHLIDMARKALGEDVILFTTDGGDEGFMTRGSIKGSSVYTVGDGCGSPQTCVDAQKAFNAPGQSPFMCSECYTGWLTHWGEAGANTSSSAPHVDSILGKFGGSISLYMGHGGTNWGFFSGANGGGGTSFQPHITSYDYDSPVSEAGEHGYHGGTDKFAAMKAVMTKYASPDEAIPPEPPLPPRTAYGDVKMTLVAPLLGNLKVLAPTAAATGTAATPAAETLGPACHYGMMLYSKTLTASDLAGSSDSGAAAGLTISAGGLRDRAQIFVDGVEMGTLYRVSNPTAAIALSGAKAGSVLQLLVENMGRINFSHGMDDDRKGITGQVMLGAKPLTGGWTTHCLPLDAHSFSELEWKPPSSSAAAAAAAGPAFYKAEFSTATATDTFLAMHGWTKGIAWVNGFNLGRYWETKGPQHTLYIPGPRLNNGTTKNELIVLELHNSSVGLNFSLRGEPELRPSSGAAAGCDPTVGAKAGAHVAMVASGPKLAHQQQWIKKRAFARGARSFVPIHPRSFVRRLCAALPFPGTERFVALCVVGLLLQRTRLARASSRSRSRQCRPFAWRWRPAARTQAQAA